MKDSSSSDFIRLLGGTASVARRAGAKPASVSEWHHRGIPEGRLIQLAAAIEQHGGPRRWQLRPEDWHFIWPELIGVEGAPPVPEPAQEAA
ncbi:MAG: YdaS family helix-turn-helix protein [Rubrivivax sp.]